MEALWSQFEGVMAKDGEGEETEGKDGGEEEEEGEEEEGDEEDGDTVIKGKEGER